MDKRGRLNKYEAYKLASYLCHVASLGSDVVIEVFWSNPCLNRVLLPCFFQICKIFVHDDSLHFLDSPVIPCSQLSYSDHSADPHHQLSTSRTPTFEGICPATTATLYWTDWPASGIAGQEPAVGCMDLGNSR